MTRKEFVVQVTEQLAANPRAVLAGHGIPAIVLKQIATRPDVMAKLATFLYMTKNFKKGSKGLKKSPIFKISGYKNFNEFNGKARTDVENFMENLADEDQITFENNNNIIAFLIMPDKASGDTESDIATGKSLAIKFDTAVKKENKIGNGAYVTVMFGDSIIRTIEKTKAKAKSKVNAKKVALKQSNAAKLKKQLMLKAKAKALAEKNAALTLKASMLEGSLQQVNRLATQFGAKSTAPTNVNSAMNKYTRETEKFLKTLTPNQKLAHKEAVNAMKSGNVKVAKRLLKLAGNDQLTSIVMNGNLTSADAKIGARKEQIKAEIAKLDARNDQKLGALEASTNAREKAQLRWEMKQISAKVSVLKAKLGTFRNLSPAAINSKAKLLKATNKLIADNIAKGNSVQASLNAAIAKIPATQQVKIQIKEQIMQQIANDVPTQYAVQQAIQQIPVAQLQFQQLQQMPDDLIDVFGEEGVFDTAFLAGTASVQDIMAII